MDYVSAAGDLSVRVVNGGLDMQPRLWEYSGKTGTDEGSWKHAVVPIGVREYRFQASLFVSLGHDYVMLI